MSSPDSPFELFGELGYNSHDELTSDDAAWVLQCAFLVLTMQTGFAMLEGGCVSKRNMANIMIKNVCDVSIGGMAYWLFGYGLSFGPHGNAFISYGDFAFTSTNYTTMGTRYSRYFFQFSFASTSTTIVSGAVAERMKLKAYMVYSFANIVIYAIPACWCWNERGFLNLLGFYDFSGVCVVHLSGGASALASSWILGPRLGRFTKSKHFQMSSPSAALTGMFILTWANLAFTCGSTFGVTHAKWKIGALVATCTLNAAIGGGLCGLILSMIYHKGQIRIEFVISSVLGGLVCITGSASIITTWESLIVGGVGATIAIHVSYLTNILRVDDPVGAIPIHFGAASWGTLAVGLFGRDNVDGHLSHTAGLFHGGGFRLLGVNALGALLIILWSGGLSLLFLFVLNKIMGIRMSEEDEIKGADLVDHDIKPSPIESLNRALDRIGSERMGQLIEKVLEFEDFLSAAEPTRTTARNKKRIRGNEKNLDGGAYIYSIEAAISNPRIKNQIQVHNDHIDMLNIRMDGRRKQSILKNGRYNAASTEDGAEKHVTFPRFSANSSVVPQESMLGMFASMDPLRKNGVSVGSDANDESS